MLRFLLRRLAYLLVLVVVATTAAYVLAATQLNPRSRYEGRNPPPPDLPPTTIYLTYPAYYIVPFHYPNPVTGKPFRPDVDQVGAYAAPPGTKEQIEALKLGRMADGTQPIAEPPRK